MRVREATMGYSRRESMCGDAEHKEGAGAAVLVVCQEGAKGKDMLCTVEVHVRCQEG